MKFFKRKCKDNTHDWRRNGDNLLYVICAKCGEERVYIARQEGLAGFPPYYGKGK